MSSPVARTRAALAIDVEREKGRRSLAYFIKGAWPQIEQGVYLSNWHIDAICEHLQAVTAGHIRNLIINVPPGSMKSLSVCVFWSAWMWLINPDLQQLFTSFDAGLTLRDGRRAQEILNSEWFRSRWGHRVRVDPREPGGKYYAYTGAGTRAGGWRFATSIEGKTTGWHPDVRVFDDPTKPKEATKDNLEKVIDWHKTTFSNRRRDPNTVAEVGIMQRLAENDLSGYLLAKGKHVHLNIPLEYDRTVAYVTGIGQYPRDPRTEDGESFWKARYTPTVIEETKATTADVGVYSCQFQQNPIPTKGTVFLLDWLIAKKWVTLPAQGIYTQSWDMSFKGESTSDYVAGGLWLNVGAEDYLVDVYHEKVDFDGAAQAVLDKSKDKLWGKAGAKLIEDKANGPAILSHLRAKVSGLIPIKVDGNAGKIARAVASAPYWKAGNVYLPEDAPWLSTFRTEHAHFPRAKNDDLVDMSSQYLNYIHDPANAGVDLATALAEAKKIGFTF